MPNTTSTLWKYYIDEHNRRNPWRDYISSQWILLRAGRSVYLHIDTECEESEDGKTYDLMAVDQTSMEAMILSNSIHSGPEPRCNSGRQSSWRRNLDAEKTIIRARPLADGARNPKDWEIRLVFHLWDNNLGRLPPVRHLARAAGRRHHRNLE